MVLIYTYVWSRDWGTARLGVGGERPAARGGWPSLCKSFDVSGRGVGPERPIRLSARFAFRFLLSFSHTLPLLLIFRGAIVNRTKCCF